MEPVNSDGRRRARFSIPVPGLTPGRSVGLGSVLKHVTSAVGIRPCSGCKERAARLDSLVQFRGREDGSRCCG